MTQDTRNKVPYTALGLIFGTAIGTATSLIITGNVLWGGVGTATGLIIGAAIEGQKNKKKSDDD